MEPFDKENINNTFNQYKHLVCDECKERMERYGKKIADALNEGKQPKMRDIIRLQGCLCNECHLAIYRERMRNE